MTRLMVLVLFLLAVPVSQAAAQSAAIERGKKVYADQKCGVCHSIAGVGNKRGSLDGVGAKLSTDEIRMWMTHAPEMTAKSKSTRKPLMRSYPNLPKEDLDALVAYMASLK